MSWRARPVIASLGLLSSAAGCWTITAEFDDVSGGVADGGGDRSVLTPDGSTSDSPPDQGPVPPGGDACARALEDAGPARFTTCFDYEGVDASSLVIGSHGAPLVAIEPGPSSTLVLAFPALSGAAAAGAHHRIPTSFAPRWVELAFDVRIAGDFSRMPEFVQVAGFYRSDVNTYLLYEPATSQIVVAEQDQRDGGNVNVPVKGGIDVDLGSWRRVVLSIDFQTSRITSRVIGGGAAPGLVLAMPTNGPGEAYVGTRYHSDCPVPVELLFDNVVVRAD